MDFAHCVDPLCLTWVSEAGGGYRIRENLGKGSRRQVRGVRSGLAIRPGVRRSPLNATVVPNHPLSNRFASVWAHVAPLLAQGLASFRRQRAEALETPPDALALLDRQLFEALIAFAQQLAFLRRQGRLILFAGQ